MVPFLALLLVETTPFDGAVSKAVREQECRGGASGDADIVVCGRRQQDERYRLPYRYRPFDPAGETESVMRERSRWAEGGEAGIQSCGPVGPGGWTGCMVRDWTRQREQYQWGKNAPKKKW